MVYTNTALECQNYDYNIRSWLLGINRAYVRDANTASMAATTSTTQTISGEMFTESSMDLQSVVFPSTSFFGFDLGYDKVNNQLISGKTYTAAQYDGNITGMVWKEASDQKVRKYDYTYDAAKRLTGAILRSSKLASVSDAAAAYAGDKLGDFQDGNKTGSDYSYDVNGNMTVDKNKNISQITYNILNLPSVIRVTGTGPPEKVPSGITTMQQVISCVRSL